MEQKTKLLDVLHQGKIFWVVLCVTLFIVIGIFIGANFLNKSRKEFTSFQEQLQKERQINISLHQSIQQHKEILVSKDKIISNMKSWKEQKSFINVNKDMLENNLKHYSKLSSSNRKIIIETVLDESRKYNINPLIVYALCDTESSFRFWIEHKSTFIKMSKKKVKIRAVGLGGIVWEWWGDKLKKANIAEVRSDLFEPKINIQAITFILNEFSKMEMLKGCKSKDESMLRRYFGGNFKSYSDKIDKKVMSIVRPNLYRY